MTKVFIGGSRRASCLTTPVQSRLDNIVIKNLPVVIGDANGADKAVQGFFHDRQYRNVAIFCSNGVCRNNIGNWPVHRVPTTARNRTAAFFSAKDLAMAQEATIGLMIWDGKSVGTLVNVFRLLKLGKKAVVYTVPDRRFIEFRNDDEWKNFMGDCDIDLKHKIEQRAKHEVFTKSQPFQTPLFG